MTNSGKRKKPTSSGGGAGPPMVDKQQFDDLLVETAAMRSEVEKLRSELDDLKQQGAAQAARSLVDKELITQLQGDNDKLKEVNKQLLDRLNQQRGSSTSATAGPMPEGSARVEQLLRAANACKVVLFTKGSATSAADVCAKLRAAASLPDYATVEAFLAGSVWIVRLHNRSFTLEVLKKWHSLRQLTGWGVDQALTKTQLAERASLKARFMELKAARALPRWHGSEIFVRMEGLGVRPAAQWLPSKAVPPRPRGPPTAPPPSAAAAAATAAPAPGVAATAAGAAGAAAPGTAGAGSSTGPFPPAPSSSAPSSSAPAGARSAAHLRA